MTTTMRPNVAISWLLASIIGVEAAVDMAGTSTGIPPASNTSESAAVIVTLVEPDVGGDGVFVWYNHPQFSFNMRSPDVVVKIISLRSYTIGGSTIRDDPPIANITHSESKIPYPISQDGLLKVREDREDQPRIEITWDEAARANASLAHQIEKYLSRAIYLDFEWESKTASGSSTSQLFAIIGNEVDRPQAFQNLRGAIGGRGADDAAREETPNQQPTASGQASTSLAGAITITTAATAATIQPTGNTTGADVASASPPGGLGRNGTIGVAVGVSVAGLLAAGALLWFLCRRRRKRRAGGVVSRHGMQSYSSDVGVRAMIPDKEMPMRLESTSRQSVYGGIGAGNNNDEDDEDDDDEHQHHHHHHHHQGVGPGRGVSDVADDHHYAPYSDRSTTSPAPQHHHHHHDRSLDNATAGATATAANPTATATTMTMTTSQPDLNWAGGNTTPTAVIASRYAHLIEEGMTAEEIRRLEEEERQLDAAIENAGRRGNT